MKLYQPGIQRLYCSMWIGVKWQASDTVHGLDHVLLLHQAMHGHGVSNSQLRVITASKRCMAIAMHWTTDG
jgi:hypothetical protein